MTKKNKKLKSSIELHNEQMEMIHDALRLMYNHDKKKITDEELAHFSKANWYLNKLLNH